LEAEDEELFKSTQSLVQREIQVNAEMRGLLVRDQKLPMSVSRVRPAQKWKILGLEERSKRWSATGSSRSLLFAVRTASDKWP
jgi:hypothetical protein